MSTRSTGRHRRQHRPSGHHPVAVRGFATAVPVGQSHGLSTKAGVLAAGTVVAGAGFFAAPAAPAHAVAIAPMVTQDVALTAATFEESLQSLLDALNVGTMGDLLGQVGTGLSTSSDLSALLAVLNPDDMSLDALTGGLLGTSVGSLLTDLGIGDDSFNELAAMLLGAPATDVTIDEALAALGLGSLTDYTGLLGPLIGLNGGDSVSDALGLLLDPLGLDPSTDTLGDIALGNGAGTLGDAELNDLLGITDAQLTAPWDDFVSNLPIGGTLLDPDGTGIVGDMDLGVLLGDLLPQGSTFVVGDGTEVTDFLDALGIFTMLGL